MIKLHWQQLETWEPGAVLACVDARSEKQVVYSDGIGPTTAWVKLQWLDYTERIPNWQDVPLATSPGPASPSIDQPIGDR